MNIAYLNIGTNIGHRQSNLDRAVALLRRHLPASDTITLSNPVDSAPWGFSSPNRFLNIGLRITTALSPCQLLQITQNVERLISPTPHRDSSGHYIDRTIDIDIIAVTDPNGNNIVVDTQQLTLPHPRMHLREFVLTPMAELAPRWRHPATGLTPAQMLNLLSHRHPTQR